MTSLVQSGRPRDDIDSLRERAGELESLLDERGAEVAQTRAALNAFRIRYRQDVTSKSRVVWGQRTFEVKGIVSPDLHKRFMDLACEELAAP